MQEGQAIAITALLKCGADVALTDKRGRTGKGFSHSHASCAINSVTALDLAKTAREGEQAVQLLQHAACHMPS